MSGEGSTPFNYRRGLQAIIKLLHLNRLTDRMVDQILTYHLPISIDLICSSLDTGIESASVQLGMHLNVTSLYLHA